MVTSVQYNLSNGQIAGWVSGANSPDPANFPVGIGHILVDDGTLIRGQRVNLTTLTLEPCPVFARNQDRAAVIVQLQAIDDKTTRSLREYTLTGDKTALQALETQAVALRTQLAALPVINP